MFKTSFHSQKERRAKEHFVKQFSLIINSNINPSFLKEIVKPKKEEVVVQSVETVENTPVVATTAPIVPEVDTSTLEQPANNEAPESNILDIINEIEEKEEDVILISEVPMEDLESMHVEDEVETNVADTTSTHVQETTPSIVEESKEKESTVETPKKEEPKPTEKVIETPQKVIETEPVKENASKTEQSKPPVDEFDAMDDDNALNELLGDENVVVDQDLETLLGWVIKNKVYFALFFLFSL